MYDEDFEEDDERIRLALEEVRIAEERQKLFIEGYIKNKLDLIIYEVYHFDNQRR